MTRPAPRVAIEASGHPVLVSCPDGSSVDRLSVDMLGALAEARERRMQAWFIRPTIVTSESLFALTSDEVPIVHDQGMAWARARWTASAAARRWADRWREGVASFWHEFGREVRHYAGDERLPSAVRTGARNVAQRALARSSEHAAPLRQYPRRLLRDRVNTSLPSSLIDAARAAARATGLALDTPIVAIDARLETDALSDANAFLARNEYAIVHVDPACSLLDVYVLSTARFVICASVDLQHVACLTNTPSLLLNAADPFIGYPVRREGVFTLPTVIDLDDGRELMRSELLTEAYFRNVRNCGFRANTPLEVRRAVEEMHDAVMHGWRDSEGQARFRSQVVEAGTALATRVRHVAEWGPDRGFIGDGRLARFQAEAYVVAGLSRPSVDEAR
jgi:hypothetical protein